MTITEAGPAISAMITAAVAAALAAGPIGGVATRRLRVLRPAAGRGLRPAGGRGRHDGTASSGETARAAVLSTRSPAALVAATTGGAVLVGVAGGPWAATFTIAGAGIATVLRRRMLRRRAHRRREADVADACLALAAELSAGAPPLRALEVVSDDWPELFGNAVDRSSIGGDPVAALRAASSAPGAGSMTAVAAAWEVSDRTGAGLGAALVSVADALRHEAGIRREAEAQLATVRTTSRLLAILPVATLLLFSSGGGAPVGFLVGHPYGRVCLVGAVVLVATGLTWVDRTARSATRSAWDR